MTYDKALAALADPTRRQMMEALAQGPRTVGALAQALPVSRPAVSQHLRVLTEAGLLEAEAQGTKRLYRIAPEGAVALRAYLDRLWSEALAAYATEAQTKPKGRQT